MSEFLLESSFSPKGDQPKAINSIVESLKSEQKHNVLLGITGSGKTFTMANVIKNCQKPTLILSHNKTLAAQLYSEFKNLFPKNRVEFFISYYDYYQPEAYLPVTDTFIEKDASINDEIDKLRLRATASLATRNDVIIVSSVSCIYGIGSPKNYNNAHVSISCPSKINLKKIMKDLVNIHYTRNDMSLEPGSFRLQGENFEIFPIYDEYPIRIELFDNQIEYMSRFDPLNGTEIVKESQVVIYPAKHFITDQDTIKIAYDNIHNELSKQVKYFTDNSMLLEAQRIKQRTLYDLEMMMELGYCSGIENYSRHLDQRKKGERPYTLLDFFPKDFLMFIDESHVSLPQIKAMYNGDRSRKETLVEHGFRLPSALDNRPLKFEEFEKLINQVVYVSATPSDYELNKTSGEFTEQIIRPTGLIDPEISVKPTIGQIDDLLSEINLTIDNGDRVFVTTLTKKMAEDLSEYLKKFGIKAEYLHSEIDTIQRVKLLESLRKGDFDVLVGINLLREGLDIPEVALVAVLDADKEGFLRSKTSLMQVAGRAARNIKGRVILYGDKITDSMKYLIEETDRRRKVQIHFNELNSIKPETIIKEVNNKNLFSNDNQADEKADKLDIDFENLEHIDAVEKLTKEMLKASKELQFEKAAIIRDKLEVLKSSGQ